MRDRKALYLLIFSLTAITISFILITIWGYHFYFSKKDTPAIAATDTTTVVRNASPKDSLLALFNATIDQLNNPADSVIIDTSGDKTLAKKLEEYNKLRSEIAEMLRNKTSAEDMSQTSQKISQLQQSVEALKSQNEQVAAENERLNKMVNQLIQQKGASPARATKTKKTAVSASSLPVLVAHLRFMGLSISNNKSEPTNIAAKTERLYGSFQVNIKPTNTNPYIYIIVIQPNGQPLINPSVKPGTFSTQAGPKTYSTYIRFDNVKDNGNRLVFSIDSPNFQKGKYAMQIYHQGVLIGRLTRTLY